MIRNQIPRGLTERGVQGCKGSVPHCHIIPLQYWKYKLILREWEEKSWTWHGNYQEYQLWGKAQEAACRGEYKNILGKSIWKYLFIEHGKHFMLFQFFAYFCLLFLYLLSLYYDAVFFLLQFITLSKDSKRIHRRIKNRNLTKNSW